MRIAPSLTAGEIREALSGVPDDVEVRISDELANDPLLPIFRVRHTRVATDQKHDTVEIRSASGNVGGKPCVVVCLTP